MNRNNISVVIPTYRREQILLDAIKYLLKLTPPPSEIIIVDQTESHEPATSRSLKNLDEQGKMKWIHLSHPSITHAMNIGLLEATSSIVLFLDDDIIPDNNLMKAHLSAHEEGHTIVAGQVLQPGEEPLPGDISKEFIFCSNRRQVIEEIMAGNFSIRKSLAIELGGFDERFVRVAYRFETEFADRAVDAGERIFFEPAASIRHLKAGGGGTRAYGEHLKTMKPSHSVGAYYYLMRSHRVRHKVFKMLSRPFRSIRTMHHLRNPWWIPLTLVSEAWGFLWACSLFVRGPKYIVERGVNG